MSTEIQKAEDTRLAAFGDLMEEDQVSGSDILMPTMLLMQPGSGMVTSEKARAGQWRGSLSENLLAEKGSTTEVIPFGFHKTWIVFKKGATKPEFVRVEPYNVRPTREREELVHGVSFQNFETINYVVMPVDEALKDTAIPYLLRFRSTGYIVGKRMETFRAQLQKAKKPHCFSTFKIGSVFKETEKGKFYVPTVEWGRDTTEAELNAIKPWIELAKAGRVKADDADLKGADEDEAADEPQAGGKFEC